MLVRGKRVPGNSDLTTIEIDGRITVARRNRPGCTKPEAKVERMETAAMSVYLMFRGRWGVLFCLKSSGYIKVRRRHQY